MRLRLRCSSAYKLGDLQWCMVHVPDHLHSVRDLSLHISSLLELDTHRAGAACKEPPQLLLDGFLVPHDEEVRSVLRDDEVVDLEPGIPTANGLPALAAQAAWSSPAASTGGKRTSDVAFNGVGADKRQRTGGKGGVAAATMALGWQSPEAAQPASRPSAAAKAAESSSDESEEVATKPAAASAPSEIARRAALATCSSASDVPATAGSAPEAEGTGIFVGGIGQNMNDDQLQRLLGQYGQVTSATVVKNPRGIPKGYGFAEFATAAARDKCLAAGPKLQLGDCTVEVKPRIAKGAGKGKDGKGKDGKGKGDKGDKGDKGQGMVKPKAKAKALESSSDEESSEDEAPKKAPAPNMAAPAAAAAEAKSPKKATKAAPPAISNEELEVQRQMAALGLPVSFTASEMPGGDSDDEEEEEEEE